MKNIFLISCLAFFGIFCEAKTNAKITTSIIFLKGKLMEPGTIRNPQTPPVEAYQNAAGVTLLFNCNIDSLSVEVLNEAGDTVYQTKVNAVAGSTLSINASNWASGTYTLLIADGLGGCLEGYFEIE